MVNRFHKHILQLKWKKAPPKNLLWCLKRESAARFFSPLFDQKWLSGEATKKSLQIHFLVVEYCTSYLLTYNIAEGCWNKCLGWGTVRGVSLLSICTAGIKRGEENPSSLDNKARMDAWFAFCTTERLQPQEAANMLYFYYLRLWNQVRVGIWGMTAGFTFFVFDFFPIKARPCHYCMSSSQKSVLSRRV